MTRNQDIAMCVLQKIGEHECVAFQGKQISVYVGAGDWVSFALWDGIKTVNKLWLTPETSDIQAVKIYNEVIEYLENEVIDNLDFQQEKQEEMLSSAERDLKAIQEVF